MLSFVHHRLLLALEGNAVDLGTGVFSFGLTLRQACGHASAQNDRGYASFAIHIAEI